MALTGIYAQLSCSDLDISIAWFTVIFEREPDARPMAGLAEWHVDGIAGFQLFESKANAGRGTLTLLVDDVHSEHQRLAAAKLNPGTVESARYTTIARLQDPDSNLVVLAQYG